jgi:hypothetical protein
MPGNRRDRLDAMKLFLFQILFKHARSGRAGVDAVVHAESIEEARELVAGKYTGSRIAREIEIEGSRHFVVADLED